MKKKSGFEKTFGKRVFNILTEPDGTSKNNVIISHSFRSISVGIARTFVDLKAN